MAEQEDILQRQLVGFESGLGTTQHQFNIHASWVRDNGCEALYTLGNLL